MFYNCNYEYFIHNKHHSMSLNNATHTQRMYFTRGSVIDESRTEEEDGRMSPIPIIPLATRIDDHRASMNLCWLKGGFGVCLFHAENDVVSVGIASSDAWSDDISMNMTNSPSRGSFEVVHWASLKSYQLSYVITDMPGIFKNNQVITITPRYSIINHTKETVCVSQKGSKELVSISPSKACSWHKSDVTLDTLVRIRSESTRWSMGTLDINEIGTSLVYLPRKSLSSKSSISMGNENNINTVADSTNAENDREILQPVVLHIDVRLAESGEDCSIVVVIHQAAIDQKCELSIRNLTDMEVSILQANIHYKNDAERELYTLTVPKQGWLPFGWADVNAKSDVIVHVKMDATKAITDSKTSFQDLDPSSTPGIPSIDSNRSQKESSMQASISRTISESFEGMTRNMPSISVPQPFGSIESTTDQQGTIRCILRFWALVIAG